MLIINNIKEVPNITNFDSDIYDAVCYFYETGTMTVSPKVLWHAAMGWDVEPLNEEIQEVIDSVNKMSETWVKVKGTSMTNNEFKAFFGKDINEAEEISESGNLLNVATLEKDFGNYKEVKFIINHNPILNEVFKSENT